jgi:hypothetical protein
VKFKTPFVKTGIAVDPVTTVVPAGSKTIDLAVLLPELYDLVLPKSSA